ncbi:predicted protein [Streptomyces viridosporus ATCC 14672]|uniref:Predicted protein n=1 Tax=Streptomyces viridosporus (strain ATCC 14672 / DSM 40746 / JCM 4963 / KCTC 9882 / NRRL B-12104 / FH 1290) TaxID=566461 RepID=D6A7P4_STRV1|nr:predicted protein [Streptomyces viridosporus ATCC 14672]
MAVPLVMLAPIPPVRCAHLLRELTSHGQPCLQDDDYEGRRMRGWCT